MGSDGLGFCQRTCFWSGGLVAPCLVIQPHDGKIVTMSASGGMWGKNTARKISESAIEADYDLLLKETCLLTFTSNEIGVTKVAVVNTNFRGCVRRGGVTCV